MMKFSEILEKLGQPTHFLGANPEIHGLAAIKAATGGTLSYIDGAKFASQVSVTDASALILPKNLTLQAEARDRNIAWLEAADPRLMFAQAIALFYQPYRPPAVIHPTAVIDPTAQIGERVAIAPHAIVQAGVTIGDDAVIHPNVVIYPGSSIGDRTVLHANCVIHEHVVIAEDCVIHSGAVIGSEGFGFVPTPQGWVKMEQSGWVILEAAVEVGCNSTIDRPAVGETRIGRGTKLDNLVHVAHGVQVGQGCVFAGQSGIAGGATIGNGVILAGQVGVANDVTVGDRAIASAQSGLHGTVPAGHIVSGCPAIDHKIYLKASAVYSRLPDLYQTVKRLRKHVDASEASE